MGNFLYDRDRGDKAEDIVLRILGPTFRKVVGRNTDWDIEAVNSKSPFTIEVKYDIKAKSTGNLAFEFSNGKKPTGICLSKADQIWYVIETDTPSKYTIFKFSRADLLQKLLYYGLVKSDKGVKVLQGGDGKRFALVIVPLKTIIEEKFGDIIEWEETSNG